MKQQLAWRGVSFLSMWCAMSAAAATQPMDPVVAQVLARDVALQEAHGRGNLDTYRAGVSKRYVYIDVSGARVTTDILLSRRENDQRRVVSSEPSEEEAIRLADNVVLLRGLDRSVATYFGGLPRVSTTRWSALWVREEDGVWRLTADTATPVKDAEGLAYVPVPQSQQTLQALAGRWTLQLQPAMQLDLTVHEGTLVGSLPGHAEKFVFTPASATHYFADKRPFELRFSADGKSLDLVTWGTKTPAVRME